MQSLVEATARTKIDALITERVAPIIAEQVRSQRAQLEAEIRREIANQSRQLKAESAPQLVGRSISQSQKSAFHDAVVHSEILNAKDQFQERYGRGIEIFVDKSDREANAYATQLTTLLLAEGWRAEVEGDHVDGFADPGLHLVQKGTPYAGTRWFGMRANIDLFRCLRLAGLEGDLRSVPSNPTQETAFIVVGPNLLTK